MTDTVAQSETDVTYAAFQAQVRRSLEEPNENVWADSSLLYWSNEAVRDISSRVRANIDETYRNTVAGVSDYALPDCTQEVTAVFYDGNRLFREAPESRWDLDSDAVGGTPVAYQRMDEVVRLRPTPSAAAPLRILRKAYAAPLTASSTAMPFRNERNSLIEYYVLSRAFEQTGDWDSADRYKQRYEAALATYDIDANIAADADGASAFPTETY